MTAMVKFYPFSAKQLLALNWWCNGSKFGDKNGLICDGAVRSGKTLCMSLSFIFWAFYSFSDTSFALCGKTISSLRRNVVTPIVPMLKSLGFCVTEKISKNLLEIQRGSVKNRFYIFGGRDEGSADLIQGMTLGGVLFDEVALMPRSFVEQALARCSVEGSKFWFNCNPEHPFHWFYNEWIKKTDEKNMLYIHFTMDDNPSLSPKIKSRYKSLYTGAFYDRFIEGKWVAADGLVYPMFSVDKHIRSAGDEFSEYYLSCDYDTGVQLTDEEYYGHLKELIGDRKITALIIDPSAASFIETVRRHGELTVIKARNDVLGGINRVCMALKQNEIFFSPVCTDTIREFSVYRWDDYIKRDAPKKENDHAMDDIRYFVNTVLAKRTDDCMFSVAVERK